MAIDLLHAFAGQGQSVSAGNKGEKVSRTSQSPQNHQIARAIRTLQAGQTIQGEIISVKGRDVQLSVMNQMVLEARLEQSISLTPGSLMAFQIKSNSSSGLSLMPLFTNTAVDPNAMKALDMAGLPLTDRTLEMVQTMMQRGLPIDKQSLQDVYRDLMAFKDGKPADIISLRQMNIPVTAENLQQFGLYENNQHFLSNTFTDIGQAVGKQLASWIQEGNPQTARAFINQLGQLFGEPVQKGPLTLDGQGSLNPGEALPQEQAQNQNPVDALGRPVQVQEGTPSVTPMPIEELPVSETKTVVITEDSLLETSPKPVQEEALEASKEQTAQSPKTATGSLSTGFEQLLKLLSQTKNPSRIENAFQKLWEQEIKPQLMLEPEQVLEKEKVQEFYEKISQKMGQMEALADEFTQPGSSLSKAIHHTNSNLDFMQQMNQMHAYIQLPLKLSNQEARGELYVFTNKRSLARQDGKVTALLHLDMEYLGKMDIYVALENQKVSTQFYLEKEEYLDFLNEHMDTLTSRLNKRGYDCSIQTCLRMEEDKPVIEKMVSNQNQPILLSTQAFDMRA